MIYLYKPKPVFGRLIAALCTGNAGFSHMADGGHNNTPPKMCGYRQLWRTGVHRRSRNGLIVLLTGCFRYN